MRLFICLIMLMSSAQAMDLKKDEVILYEAVKKIDQALKFYHSDISIILNKFKNEEHLLLNKIEREKVNTFWTVLIDHRIVLHSLYNSYRKSNINYKTNLIRYTANLHLQLSGAILSKALWSNIGARRKLNETNIEQIPRGSFVSLENELFRNFNHSIDKIDLPTLFPALDYKEDYVNFVSFDKNPTTDIEIELESLNSLAKIKLEHYLDFVQNNRHISEVKRRFIKYKFKNIFYFISKKISTWLGDTKLRNRNPDYYNGQTLINIDMAKKMEQKVKPGDIMVSRTNWFLSNAFLPGFWPHSFLYIGDYKKLKEYFNDASVDKYFTEKCQLAKIKCSSFISYLAKAPKTASAFKQYLLKDKYGFSKVLIEGTSDGIHFSSIRHTFLNDYLAAMRPLVSKQDKALAIIDAFENFGLEYDFDFDYQTDDRLVCSELVAKSYEVRPGKMGLSMNYDIDKGKYLEFIMGRVALPVINFVHKIYDESKLQTRRSEMKFIAFLKGNRKLKKASFSTEKDFLESRNWKKWSFMQK